MKCYCSREALSSHLSGVIGSRQWQCMLLRSMFRVWYLESRMILGLWPAAYLCSSGSSRCFVNFFAYFGKNCHRRAKNCAGEGFHGICWQWQSALETRAFTFAAPLQSAVIDSGWWWWRYSMVSLCSTSCDWLLSTESDSSLEETKQIPPSPPADVSDSLHLLTARGHDYWIASIIVNVYSIQHHV